MTPRAAARPPRALAMPSARSVATSRGCSVAMSRACAVAMSRVALMAMLRVALMAMPLALALLVASCGGSGDAVREPAAGPPPAAAPPARGPVRSFSYETLDGRELSTTSLAGRFSVIGFVATYDVASQAEARFLAGLFRDHTPRINAALLVLEASENRPLVEAFVATLKLPYPVAMADAPTIAGEGPFAGLHHVPSVVILDAEGREVFRHVGLITQETLEEVLRGLEDRPAAR